MEHRYLFTVRQRFGKTPVVDAFYKVQVPSGLTGDQAKLMTVLDDRFCKAEMAQDTSALNGMQTRLRFNPDMFQDVCLVRTKSEIDAETLESIIEMKHEENSLLDFLTESAVRG